MIPTGASWNSNEGLVMKKDTREYEIGNKSVDRLIDQLTCESCSRETEYLIREILTTAVKLGMESGDEGDLKLVNNALKELRYSFKIFTPYRNVKKVIIFGSARTRRPRRSIKRPRSLPEDDGQRIYDSHRRRPGIMEAGNKGARAGKEFALNIRLPLSRSLIRSSTRRTR
jgi:hypothetical protein